MDKYFTFLFLLFAVNTVFAQGDTTSNAQKTDDQRFNLHFQTTYIYQYKPAINAAYTGAHSFEAGEENHNSLTATLYLGARLWKGCELYINPEIAGGSGLSQAFGLGGSTNGETFRVGDPSPTLYLARAYIKQTFPIGKEIATQTDFQNQLIGSIPAKYFQLIIGKYCIGDFYDNNNYSNSPRTQFMNWALMNNGAWDYAANVRGYNYAVTAILQLDNIAFKSGLALLPTVANGPNLNENIGEAYGINTEVVKNYTLKGQSGNLRILGYYNSGSFGDYKQALNHLDYDGKPDFAPTRKPGNHKFGFGINADQQLNESLGLFARLGWNDGKTETWCFTEVDQTFSTGFLLNGKKWKRPDDNLGGAILINGLSDDHKKFLAAGGLGFELGDGRLTAGTENVLELFYNIKPFSKPVWITGDYQFILNPGYNKDRGPANVFSLRAHIEF